LQERSCFSRVLEELTSEKFVRFCKEYNVKIAVLFGSLATGKANNDSDVDLAVLLEKDFFPNGTFEAGKLKRKIIRELTDLLETSKIDLVLLNQVSSLLSFQVAKTGKLIYQRNSGDFAGFASLALRRHNDAKLFYQLDQKYLLKKTNQI
jgi:predicted nucleotidyltransferase